MISIQRLRRRLVTDERGIAMVVVMAMVMVVSVLVVAIFSRVVNEQRNVARDRNVTTAREASEAGVDEIVYKLGIGNNWSTFPTSYGSTPYPVTNVGGGSFTGTVKVNPANPQQLVVTMQGKYPANSGRTRTVEAIVQRSSPPAFDYSMFASTKIQIHHHNSWLSPDVLTTKVHSNGDITLDGPSQYKLESISAVGSIEFESGFAKLPDGTGVPTAGYNWTDPRPPGLLCFPGRTAGACTASSPKYKGYASITGNVLANTVTVNSRGQTLAGTAETTLTGQVLPVTNGDVKASSVKVGATTYTTQTAANGCTACGKGAASGGAQLGGAITISPNYSPAVIPFPTLNYAATYKALRAQPQGHVFTSPTAFLDYITTPANGFYRNVDPATGALSNGWTAGTAPQAIVLDGDWYLTAGNLSLSWSDILTRTKAKTGVSSVTQAPIIIIRGSLINETGALDITTPLAVVGAGNTMDFLLPGTAPAIDLTKFLDANAIEPGVVAAGGNIHGDDCDTDASWTSPSTYEPLKTCPIYVRGLVYSAAYNATTKTSVPSDQHWHNEDPKNLVKIFGAQVGDTLHDCSNFNFTYDPLVKKAFGFSGSGTVVVQDFRELGA
jgi:hypothetical protein